MRAVLSIAQLGELAEVAVERVMPREGHDSSAYWDRVEEVKREMMRFAVERRVVENAPAHSTLYVACSSSELARARAAMLFARRLGFEIAHDWVADVEREGSANDVPEDVAIRCADVDVEAACTADLFWLLVGPKVSIGASGELVARIRERGRSGIVISGGKPSDSIFYRGCWHVPTDLEAIPFLLERAERRGAAS